MCGWKKQSTINVQVRCGRQVQQQQQQKHSAQKQKNVLHVEQKQFSLHDAAKGKQNNRQSQVRNRQVPGLRHQYQECTRYQVPPL